ncbi:hypothetical protein ACH4FX_38910 [Streptomyces sp. NPDC018019]|uniref:hypothetical protein n=1 Tax=Streptomyces sp. NPDC018019 TaxID=3365030 RepID=UPI0037B25D24
MIGEVREYTLTCANDQVHTVPLAKEIAPGLLVYRLPNEMHPDNPHRWRIGHEASGLSVTDAMTREEAVATAETLGTLADWTQDADTLRATVDPEELFAKVRAYHLATPADPAHRMAGDVSGNGIYTDADIEEAAREAKADGLNAYEILIAMSHTVPWMGLDTEEFNEAHDRIVRLADAA